MPDLYLSRLILNSRSRQAQSEWCNPYELHRTMARGFPNLEKAEYEAARVLFRLDEDDGRWCVLVQSKIAPDWSALTSMPNYLCRPPESQSWSLHVEGGQRFRFRLLANPTFRPSVDKNARPTKNTGRRGLFYEYERLDWLLHRAREHGFDFETHEITVMPTLKKDGEVKLIFRGNPYYEPLKLEVPTVDITDLNDGRRFPWIKEGPRKEKDQFSAARFDGILTVSDREKFLTALENGIGPAKGFGFGLLSLARA